MVVFDITDHMCGVYVIRCNPTNKVYVGSATRTFAHRWRLHRMMLSENRHHSITLQRAWNKYGAEAFSFEISEVTERVHSVAVEQVYIDYYRACDPRFGFNVCPVAGSSRGVKQTDETKRKVSAAGSGRIRSAETRKRMSESALQRNDLDKCAARLREMNKSRTGHNITETHREKISQGGKGKLRSEETKQRMRKPKTEEHRIKMSEAAKKRCLDPEYIQKLKDGVNAGLAKRKEARRGR